MLTLSTCQVHWSFLMCGKQTTIKPDPFRDPSEKISRAVLHNPELYPDPERFKPERFLNEDGTFRDDPIIALAFGAGKRICPARHLVEMILFIFVSSALSVFHVKKAKDENGYEIPVKIEALVEGRLTM